ncbi:hypothetical protein Q672_09880 [Marinobacter sp. EVN1]|uniref:hypothetical protein n=1 Tax=Marinobacter sp. EVN1 TaxID=1397532 RepID=UPI0003B91FF7|nr:hypothetical protein [Marinobacter sp. EVN1]ERS81609.1 hypothetical protein Q672_09880 [Marinobacter sp. EVN1]
MTNVTLLHPTPTTIYRYKAGDITRALAEGLKHESIAADIEKVLHDVLFFPEHDPDEQYGALCEASNTIYNLLYANGTAP